MLQALKQLVKRAVPLSVVAVLLPVSGFSTMTYAASFDFQAWIAANGEQGFQNSAPFTLTDSGLTLTATAFELPGNTDSHVYMDDLFNGIIGGMGVCSVLGAGNQCTPSSDDNVSIDAGKSEKLNWQFDQNITQVTLELGDADHYTFNSRSFDYMYNGGSWTNATTDSSGMVTLSFSGTSGALKFRAAGATYADQFYIRNATVVPVPVPAAAWLFGSGLLGLVGVARRNRAA